jgi:uncharacterized peroxidase-related enzyme
MTDDIAAIDLPDEESLDVDTRGYFQKCRDKLGFVPNVFRAYSLRPERFRKYQAYRNDLMRSSTTLSPLEREMIAVTVSSANRCHYCLVAHGQVLRELSGDAALSDSIALNYRAATLSGRHRTMLDFAWKLTLEPNSVNEHDRQKLRQAGFTDDGIFEISEVAAFYNMSNRFAIGLGIAPNQEYFLMNR